MKDIIIIGSGPAGLAALIYAVRYNLDVMVIGEELGGNMNESFKIENYPGFAEISGFELGQKMKEHAEILGGEIKQGKVVGIDKNNNGFVVRTEGEEYETKKVILTVGTVFKKLGIPGEDEFNGRGVSYCATCDGPFFKNKKVVVAGGANSAFNAALLLSRMAKEVTIFYRGDKPTAIPRYVEDVKKSDNITMVSNTNLTKIKGDKKVEQIILDKELRGSKEKEVDGVFIEIGSRPEVSVFENLGLDLDKKGFVIVNPDQSTNVKGFYAAGDITTNSNGYRQIITACSEGSIAVAAIAESK